MLLELLVQMDTVQTIVQDGLFVLEMLYIEINQDGPAAIRQVWNLMDLLVLLVISKNYWGGLEVENRSVSSGGISNNGGGGGGTIGSSTGSSWNDKTKEGNSNTLQVYSAARIINNNNKINNENYYCWLSHLSKAESHWTPFPLQISICIYLVAGHVWELYCIY